MKIIKTSINLKKIKSTVLLSLMFLMLLQLKTSNVFALTGPEDAYEDNDTIYNAIMLYQGIYNLTLGDEDWFYIDNISTNSIINISITFDGTSCDMDLSLYNSTFNLLMISNFSTNTTNDTETIFYNVTVTSGIFYFSITTLSSYINETYLLNVNIIDGIPIGDDSFEDNDDFSQAAFISFNNYYSLAQFDNDYYYFDLNQNDTITINFDYDDFIENLTISLYNYNGSIYQFIMYSTYNSTFGGQTIQYTSNYPENSSFYIEVKGYNSGLMYNMSLIYSPASIIDDSFEENDNYYEAKEVYVGNYYDSLVLADDDWYFVYLNFSDVCDGYDIFITFGPEANIYYPYASLYDSNYTYITGLNPTSANTFEILNFTHPAGTYYIYISYGTAVEPLNYTLEIYQSYCEECMNDDYLEENDFHDEAYMVFPGFYSDLVLCDFDFYKISAKANDYIEITLNWAMDLNIDLIVVFWRYNPEYLAWEPINEVNYTQEDNGIFTIKYLVPAEGMYVFDIEEKFDPNQQTSDTTPIPIIFYSMNIKVYPQADSTNTTNDTTNNTTNTTNDTTNTADLDNPFGAIPGFPLEILAPVVFFTMLAVTLRIRKKKH